PHVRAGLARRHQSAIPQQFAEYHVAHAESEGGQIGAAERGQERVITTAAANRAELALRVKELEDDSRVIRQAANDREVEHQPIAVSECHYRVAITLEAFEFLRSGTGGALAHGIQVAQFAECD